jgi:hypothetical protein
MPYIYYTFFKNYKENRSFQLLGPFTELRKATLSCPSLHPSLCLSVCLSGWLSACNKLGSHWTGFYCIWYLILFRKSVEKIHVSLKSDKNNGYFTWTCFHIYGNISLSSS